MARAHKRITRKDLRQPDQFVTFTGRLVEQFEENRRILLIVVSGAIVLALMAWGWNLYQGRQNRLAATEFSRALNLYQDQKLTEALDKFQTVEGYGGSSYATLAMLYQANLYIANGDWDEALETAGRFAKEVKGDPFLQQIAFWTLGYAQEQKGRCKEAIEHYSASEKLAGAFKEQALLGRARCSAQIGDNQGAVAAYQQYLKEFPSSAITSDVSLRMQSLEGQGSKPYIVE